MTESDTHLAYYLVLVTDVLGQRSRLRDLRELPQSEEDQKAAVEILRDTVGFLMAWRAGFRNHFTEWGTPSSCVEQLSKNVRDSVIQACSSDGTYRQFSDTIMVSVCLSDDGKESCNALMGVLGVLLATCGIHLLSLHTGQPTRSGLDVGLAMPLPEGDVYGPALERAAHLEAKSAGYPRIAVGQELTGYLADIASREPSSPFGTIAKNAAQSCQKLIFQDADGVLALDFLGEELRRHDIHANLTEVLPKAYRFVGTAQLRFRGQQDLKLDARYDTLWAYFRSRAHVWGSEIEHLAYELEDETGHDRHNP